MSVKGCPCRRRGQGLLGGHGVGRVRLSPGLVSSWGTGNLSSTLSARRGGGAVHGEGGWLHHAASGVKVEESPANRGGQHVHRVHKHADPITGSVPRAGVSVSTVRTGSQWHLGVPALKCDLSWDCHLLPLQCGVIRAGVRDPAHALALRDTPCSPHTRGTQPALLCDGENGPRTLPCYSARGYSPHTERCGGAFR